MRQITEPQARAAFQILIEECGHHGRDAESFVYHVTRDCQEYRFMGELGFGGKFKSWSDTPYVDCYREDETPERLAMIEAANKRLAELFNG